MRLTQNFLVLIFIASLLASCGDSRHKTLDDSHPYLDSSQYTNVLKQCASADTAIGSCTINKLPPLGMEFLSPSIADVMGRVVVSDDWMGERFEQLLQNIPSDMLQLLGAVTAIVIDADIRPSYYHNVTGAIYLDPANLWITLEEKAVINRKPDYRQGYADPMAFRSFWRYTKDSGPSYTWYGLDSTEDRPFEDMIQPMASLLYHELAHANDIFPVSSYDSVDRSRSIYAVTEGLYESYPSTQLKQSTPLLSQEMMHLASILFLGATPSDEDTKITASEAGSFFAADVASDDYAYSSQYEDLAMLFEEAMMKFHFNVDRDIAYIDYAPNAEYCDDHKVAWGVRNRIADENVKQRAQFVLQQLLPAEDYTSLFDSLAEPIALQRNSGWCTSINVNPVVGTSARLKIQSRKAETLRPDAMTRLYKVHH